MYKCDYTRCGCSLMIEHECSDLFCRFFLHPRNGVRIGVECDADRCVAESLADHLRMYSRLKRQCRMGVPKAV